jgi:hypothetical protein
MLFALSIKRNIVGYSIIIIVTVLPLCLWQQNVAQTAFRVSIDFGGLARRFDSSVMKSSVLWQDKLTGEEEEKEEKKKKKKKKKGGGKTLRIVSNHVAQAD